MDSENSFNIYLDAIDSNNNRLIDVKSKLWSINGKLRNIFINKLTRERLRFERDGLSREIFYLNRANASIANTLHSSSFFSSEEVGEFLTSIISEVENSPYEKIDVTLLVPNVLFLGDSVIDNDIEEIYTVIAPSSSAYQIKERILSSKCNSIYDIIGVMNDFPDKSMVIKKEDLSHIYDFKKREVPSKLISEFPYLEGSVIDLLSSRIDNPDLTFSEVMSFVVENTKEKVKNSSELGLKKKKS